MTAYRYFLLYTALALSMSAAIYFIGRREDGPYSAHGVVGKSDANRLGGLEI